MVTSLGRWHTSLRFRLLAATLVALAMIALPLGLIGLQPDLGSAMVVAAAAFRPGLARTDRPVVMN